MDVCNKRKNVPWSGDAVAVCFGNELPDFARLGVASKPGLLKYGRSVQHDFEAASV